MFLNRYEIHERGDKVSFRDSRVAWVYILIFLLFGGLTILFAILSGVGHYDDFSATVLIIFVGVIITCLFVSCCEVKFVVTPEYISAKYGLIGRKFKFNNVDICYVNSERYITLMDEKGRELTLNLQHLPEEAGDYVTRAARENQVKVRSIGLFESNENTTNNSYNFKLIQKAYVFGIVMFIGFILAIDIPLTEVLIEGVEDQGMFILVLVIMIANTAFWLFFILRYTQFIYINGQEIEIRGLIRKPRVFNVKDISYVYTHENKYNTKAGSYQVEEMDIYVDGELVKIPSSIGRGYKKYDMFVAFLQDNGVPFSLTKDEKITYKEVEEKSQQEIPELLNLDEHAFTCDDNYIIENGIFQGMKLEEEPEEEIDYSDYHKGIKRFLVFAKLFQVLGQISLIVAMIALKADLLSFLQAIIIPGSCYLLLFIFATLCDLYCYSVITKDASCYPATVFSAYQIEDDLTVFYAYNAGSTVRVAEPYEANKKLDYYLKRYGEPTYIWSNFEKAPVFIEGDADGPKGKGKYVGKLILLITILFLLLAVFFGYDYYSAKYGVNNSEPERNENAEEILIDYGDTSVLFTTLYEDMELPSYKWGAAATSLYAYMEDGDPEILTGHDYSKDIKDATLTFLDKAWHITDAESAQDVIDRHINYGHRASYKKYVEENKEVNKAIELLQKDYGKQFDYETARKLTPEYFDENGISTRNFYKVKGAACAYVRFGENALDGYDYLRLIRIVALCNRVGFLSDGDYLQLIYNLDTALQKEYSSFEEIHECYYYGEMFRLEKDNDDAKSTTYDIVEAIHEMDKTGFYDEIDGIFSSDLTE